MATIIKIKRSSGTTTPNLGQGELGYSWGTGTYVDFQSATVTSYGKMFLGTGTETAGIAANIEIIGGKYFTDMLDHGHGTVTANSAAIVDSAKKVNEWNVDNITLDLNTISTTNTNGDLNIDTNGSGDVNIVGAATVGTNLFNITDGTATRFSVDSFSGATTISSGSLSASEELLNITSTWNNGTSTFYGIKFDVTNTASGANSRLIDLSVGGTSQFNVDTAGNVYMSGNVTTVGTTDMILPDNTAGAYTIREGSNNYLKFDTTDTAELITFGNTLTSINEVIKDNVANAYVVKEATNQYIAVDTTNGSELVKFQTGGVQITNNLAVNGGQLTTSATTFNIADSATTVTLGNTGTGARTVNIGTAATGGASTLTFGGAVTGNIVKISGTAAGTINLTTDVTSGTANIFTSVTGTTNIGGAAATVNVGTTAGNSILEVRGNATTGTATIQTNTGVTTANVFNTVATTGNLFGAATTTNIGAAAATVNIGTTAGNSTLEVRGNATTGTATIQTNSGVTTANVFNTVATTGNLFGAATTVTVANTGTAARTVSIATAATAGASTMTFGGAVTGNTFKVAGTAAGTTNLSSDVTTGAVNVFTGVTSGTINYGSATTLHDFGNVNIQGNVISTDTVGTTQLILDPFPTGGDSAGEVVVRGNLTVNGTTTTVNSTEVSVNDPIFTLGDAVTTKMVTSNASIAADVTAGAFVAGTTYTIVSVGTTNFTLIGAASNTVGVSFTATGVGSGTGTAHAQTIIVDSPTAIVETSSVTGTNIAASTEVRNLRTRFYTSAQMAGTQTAVGSVTPTNIYTYNTSTTTYELIGQYVGKGANYLEIDLNPNIALREDDYYVGLQLRDANIGTPNNVTIARDSANNKVFTTGATLTLNNKITSGITAPQEVTLSQGADDNMDRGVQYRYYNAGLKTGYFGYDASGIVEDVTTYYFTYIPVATNTNNVLTGTVGSAYFKTVKIDDGVTNGIAFYDTYKRLTRTVAAGTSDATTSYQILTVNASGVPTWTTTIDGGSY